MLPRVAAVPRNPPNLSQDSRLLCADLKPGSVRWESEIQAFVPIGVRKSYQQAGSTSPSSRFNFSRGSFYSTLHNVRREVSNIGDQRESQQTAVFIGVRARSASTDMKTAVESDSKSSSDALRLENAEHRCAAVNLRFAKSRYCQELREFGVCAFTSVQIPHHVDVGKIIHRVGQFNL